MKTFNNLDRKAGGREMTQFVLKSIGLINPTELERRKDGHISSAISQEMSIDETINYWKKRFYDFGDVDKSQIVYATEKAIKNMCQRTLVYNKSVEELFAERGVTFKKYTPTNREWLESLSDAELAGYISTLNYTNTHPMKVLEWLKAEHKEEV